MDTSLADIAAVTRNNNDEWCGGSGLWLFAILALMGGGFGGWGNRGYGAGDYGQFATAASQQEILFGQQFSNLDNKMDRGFTSIGNGIADATFALNNSVTNEGRAIQMQLANCCCENKAATAQVRYDMANFAAATQQAIHAEGEATRNLLQQNKIESLQGQISQLQLQAAMCGVVRYPTATTFAASNPFCNCNNGGGCGGNF